MASPLYKADFQFVAEAIRGALVEIELCDDISQGVEDDLVMALDILKEAGIDHE